MTFIRIFRLQGSSQSMRRLGKLMEDRALSEPSVASTRHPCNQTALYLSFAVFVTTSRKIKSSLATFCRFEVSNKSGNDLTVVQL